MAEVAAVEDINLAEGVVADIVVVEAEAVILLQELEEKYLAIQVPEEMQLRSSLLLTVF